MDEQKPERKPFLTDSEHFLLKAERYDRYLRAATSFVLALLVAFNIFNILQLQSIARTNRTNIIHQHDLEVQYIRCILLLRFNNPPITQTSTQAEVETALDKCATSGRQ